MSYSSNQSPQVMPEREKERELVLLFPTKHRFEKIWLFSQTLSPMALMAYLSFLLFSRNLLWDVLHLTSADIPQSHSPLQNNNSGKLAYQESNAEPGYLGHVSWDHAFSVSTAPPLIFVIHVLKSEIKQRVL